MLQWINLVKVLNHLIKTLYSLIKKIDGKQSTKNASFEATNQKANMTTQVSLVDDNAHIFKF